MTTQESLIAAFEAAWREIVTSAGSRDPYGQGFERAMRIALGDAEADKLIARVAMEYLTGTSQSQS